MDDLYAHHFLCGSCFQFGTHRLLERALGEDVSELGRIGALPVPEDLKRHRVPYFSSGVDYTWQQRSQQSTSTSL